MIIIIGSYYTIYRHKYGVRNTSDKGQHLGLHPKKGRPEVWHTLGFTTAAGCPRWGHPGEARGVPHRHRPPPPCAATLHQSICIHRFNSVLREVLICMNMYEQCLRVGVNARCFNTRLTLNRKPCVWGATANQFVYRM